jgi:hypothetical protein
MEKDLFFSGETPDLINKQALESIDKILDNDNQPQLTTGDHLFKIYDDYIKPNLFALIIILVISVFLFIRYIIKQYNESIEAEEEEIVNSDNTIDTDNFTLESEDNNEMIRKNNEHNEPDDEFTDDDESDKNLDCGSKFSELNEEYKRAVRENSGSELVSNEMLREVYKKKKDKYSFDEVTKLLVEGGSTY